MMAGPPEYSARVAPPGGPSFTMQPLPPVAPPSANYGDGGAVAMAQLGGELLAVAAKMKAAQDQTQAAKATTDYLTRLDQLEQSHAEDADFQAAPDKFVSAQRELETELSA